MRKHYDFTQAKAAKDVPHLSKFHKQNSGKTRITIMLDNVILDTFKERADDRGIGYQTLINQTLLAAITNDAESLTPELLRKILREELNR